MKHVSKMTLVLATALLGASATTAFAEVIGEPTIRVASKSTIACKIRTGGSIRKSARARSPKGRPSNYTRRITPSARKSAQCRSSTAVTSRLLSKNRSISKRMP